MVTVGRPQAEQQGIRVALDAGVTEPRVISWHYAAPAVVLGRGQRPSPELLGRADREHLEVIGRASGGGAVMAGPWLLSLTLLLPAAHALARMSLPAGYRVVGDACRRALDRLRLPTELASKPASPAAIRPHEDDELDWACFGGISHGELVAAGRRKLVGVSQVRRRDAIAVCIGVLLGRPDWETLVRVWLGRDDPRLVRQLEDRTATCEQLAPAGRAPSVEAVAAALEAELPAAGPAA
jgi:lipoate-protein ligase A